MENNNLLYKMDKQDENTETTYLLKDKFNAGKRKQRTASKLRKLLVLTSCIIQQLLSGGIGYGLSVMYVELITVFNAKRSEVALIQSIYMGITIAGGIFFTGTIKKFGPGKSMVVGGTIGCVGLFTSSLGGGLTEIIICTGIISSSGMCICYLSAFISVGWMFHEDPGFFLVCLSFGVSLGQFIIPFFFEMFISQYSWSGAFILMSGVALQNIPCGVLVQYSKQYYVAGETHKKSEKQLRSYCDVTLVKDFVIWIILINFHLVSLTGNLEAWFLVDIAVSRGFTRQSGSVLVSAMGFSNFIGRIIGAFLRFNCVRLPTIYHWVYLPLLLAVEHVLVVNLYDYWGLFCVCIMYGTTFGMCASQCAAIMFEATDLDRFPQAMAIANVMFGAANFIGGFLGGLIMDTLGTYDLVFYIAAGISVYVSVSTVFVAHFIRKRRQRSDICKSSEITNCVTFKALK